jgi:putative hydrolase of the HAD superfamily
MTSNNSKIKLALFDFGGVIADEGFKQGLFSISRENNINTQEFYSAACSIISDCGYLTGDADEKTFWQEVRKQFSLIGTDEDFRDQIFSRFTIRDWMLETVEQLRDQNILTAILSDQTDWLDRLNNKYDFFKYFDRVFNSFYLKQSKHNGWKIYDTVLNEMSIPANFALFIDDNENNIKNAEERGLNAILFKDRESFETKLKIYC